MKKNKVLVKYHEPYNLQQVFNAVWEWAKTHEINYDPDDNRICLYRNYNNTNACFIGACIPDCFYTKDIEKAGVEFLEESLLSKIFNDYLVNNAYILDKLQRIHDNSVGQQKEQIFDSLRRFAESFNLVVPTK